MSFDQRQVMKLVKCNTAVKPTASSARLLVSAVASTVMTLYPPRYELHEDPGTFVKLRVSCQR
ncbi:hypothetical protein SP19_60 [Salmonella phage 19]|nr:hypothetical protein SP19_60 [Salmonella phage 19]